MFCFDHNLPKKSCQSVQLILLMNTDNMFKNLFTTNHLNKFNLKKKTNFLP